MQSVYFGHDIKSCTLDTICQTSKVCKGTKQFDTSDKNFLKLSTSLRIDFKGPRIDSRYVLIARYHLGAVIRLFDE
jgi:hypothetical protein